MNLSDLVRNNLPIHPIPFVSCSPKLHVQLRLKTAPIITSANIEFLILHIENHTKTEVERFWVESSREILNVIFKSNKAFKKLPIPHYLLTDTIVPIENSKFFSRNDKVLILTNVKNDAVHYLTIYIKNLVPENNINQYYESKIFSNTFIVEFERKISFEQLEKRNRTKPILNKQNFVLKPAFNTNAFVMRFKTASNRNDRLFKENGQCAKMNNTYIFKFETIAKERNILDEDAVFMGYEKCYNLDLVSSKIGVIDKKLLDNFIEKQEGRLAHFIKQYFPFIFLSIVYFNFFLKMFTNSMKKRYPK